MPPTDYHISLTDDDSDGNGEYLEPLQESGFFRYDVDHLIGGRFRVCERAAGGYGHVYLCYDVEQDYFYALKTLKLTQTVLDNPNTFPRLRREVKTWIDLGQHDHIVRCFGFELWDNLPFAILEWVADTDHLCELYREQYGEKARFFDWYARLGQQGLALRNRQATRNQKGAGTSLAAWIFRKQGLSVDFALQVTLDICAGMQYAQTIHPGLVHRDLKPANVLLNEQLQAKVTDFGTAVLVKDFLEPGKPSGTAEYRAPEQWNGESLDTRTDIYAMGCMLFAMLMGQPPFTSATGNSEQLRELHLYASPPHLSSRFPPALDAIVQTCLHKDPSGRFASFAALTQALTAIHGSARSTVSSAGASKPAETLESVNRTAVTHRNLGNYETALAHFARAIQLDSSYPNTYTNRGGLHYLLGQYEAALADYAAAIRLGRASINSRAFNNRGLLYLARSQMTRAETQLTLAIKLDETYANAYANRAVVYIQGERYVDALTDCALALAHNPQHTIAKHNRGYVYHLLDRLDEAIAGYTEALEHDPAFVQALVNRYLAYLQLGRVEEAQEDYAQLGRLGHQFAMGDPQKSYVVCPPDPQFANTESLEAQIERPFQAQRMSILYWSEATGAVERPTGQMPLQSTAWVVDVTYADRLHSTILRRQAQGERITQIHLRIQVGQGDGKYKPFPDEQECDMIVDTESQRKMEASGLRNIDDLKGHMVLLHNEHPADVNHPLRLWIVH